MISAMLHHPFRGLLRAVPGHDILTGESVVHLSRGKRMNTLLVGEGCVGGQMDKADEVHAQASASMKSRRDLC
jgi:hypothetical protein